MVKSIIIAICAAISAGVYSVIFFKNRKARKDTQDPNEKRLKG